MSTNAQLLETFCNETSKEFGLKPGETLSETHFAKILKKVLNENHLSILKAFVEEELDLTINLNENTSELEIPLFLYAIKHCNPPMVEFLLPRAPDHFFLIHRTGKHVDQEAPFIWKAMHERITVNNGTPKGDIKAQLDSLDMADAVLTEISSRYKSQDKNQNTPSAFNIAGPRSFVEILRKQIIAREEKLKHETDETRYDIFLKSLNIPNTSNISEINYANIRKAAIEQNRIDILQYMHKKGCLAEDSETERSTVRRARRRGAPVPTVKLPPLGRAILNANVETVDYLLSITKNLLMKVDTQFISLFSGQTTLPDFWNLALQRSSIDSESPPMGSDIKSQLESLAVSEKIFEALLKNQSQKNIKLPGKIFEVPGILLAALYQNPLNNEYQQVQKKLLDKRNKVNSKEFEKAAALVQSTIEEQKKLAEKAQQMHLDQQRAEDAKKQKELEQREAALAAQEIERRALEAEIERARMLERQKIQFAEEERKLEEEREKEYKKSLEERAIREQNIQKNNQWLNGKRPFSTFYQDKVPYLPALYPHQKAELFMRLWNAAVCKEHRQFKEVSIPESRQYIERFREQPTSYFSYKNVLIDLYTNALATKEMTAKYDQQNGNGLFLEVFKKYALELSSDVPTSDGLGSDASTAVSTADAQRFWYWLDNAGGNTLEFSAQDCRNVYSSSNDILVVLKNKDKLLKLSNKLADTKFNAEKDFSEIGLHTYEEYDKLYGLDRNILKTMATRWGAFTYDCHVLRIDRKKFNEFFNQTYKNYLSVEALLFQKIGDFYAFPLSIEALPGKELPIQWKIVDSSEKTIATQTAETVKIPASGHMLKFVLIPSKVIEQQIAASHRLEITINLNAYINRTLSVSAKRLTEYNVVDSERFTEGYWQSLFDALLSAHLIEKGIKPDDFAKLDTKKQAELLTELLNQFLKHQRNLNKAETLDHYVLAQMIEYSNQKLANLKAIEQYLQQNILEWVTKELNSIPMESPNTLNNILLHYHILKKAYAEKKNAINYLKKEIHKLCQYFIYESAYLTENLNFNLNPNGTLSTEQEQFLNEHLDEQRRFVGILLRKFPKPEPKTITSEIEELQLLARTDAYNIVQELKTAIENAIQKRDNKAKQDKPVVIESEDPAKKYAIELIRNNPALSDTIKAQLLASLFYLKPQATATTTQTTNVAATSLSTVHTVPITPNPRPVILSAQNTVPSPNQGLTVGDSKKLNELTETERQTWIEREHAEAGAIEQRMKAIDASYDDDNNSENLSSKSAATTNRVASI